MLEKVWRKYTNLNDASRAKRFAAGVVGGASGEVFVADVENIGTIGDAFDIGPTQLDLDESQDPQEDAGRKLLNRLKFGADSALYFPFIFGGTKAIGKVANMEKI